MNTDINKLERIIGYEFKNVNYLITALTHKSYAFEKGRNTKNNERLEFLGDAVLELVSSDFLYRTYKDKSEGEMTKLRAALVCEPTLAMDAKDFGLQDFIFLGVGEEKTGGRYRDSIVSDALEAVIGAIYLDGGINYAEQFIIKYILNDIDRKKLFYDSKSVLQERLAGNDKGELKYTLVKESGPEHLKEFEVEVSYEDKVIGHGVGPTKKKAEQMAAMDALNNINKRNS